MYALKQTSVNNYLAGGGSDGNIYLWDTSTYVLVATLIGHTNKVFLLDITPSGLLLSASYDLSVRIWNLLTSTYLSFVNNAVQSTSNQQMRVVSDTQVVIGGYYQKIQFITISSSSALSFGTFITTPTCCIDDFRLTSQNILVVTIPDHSVYFYNLNNSALLDTKTPYNHQGWFIDIIGILLFLSFI
jgi:WD40 repeat protein